MRTVVVLFFGALLIVLAVPGCGPSLGEDDLGTIITEEKDLPGADRPYKLPHPNAAAPAEPEGADAETDS